MAKALALINVGEAYTKFWNDHCAGAMRAYAARHGYAVVVFDRPLDPSDGRPPQWQKLLILEQPELRGFDDVVWLDSDILINFHRAPCIVTANGSDKVGAISFKRSEMGSPAKLDNRWGRRSTGGIRDWYRSHGFGDDVDDFTNTGVMVLKPRLHAAIFRWVYDNCEERPDSHQENGALSYHLFRNDLINVIDERFNVSWNGEVMEKYRFLLNDRYWNDAVIASLCVNAAWENAWFLHFLNSKWRRDIRLVAQDSADVSRLQIVVT